MTVQCLLYGEGIRTPVALVLSGFASAAAEGDLKLSRPVQLPDERAQDKHKGVFLYTMKINLLKSHRII